ncbi:5939_t:CDS:2 [Entrophospora sp. SA101]|nr:5939_t:CDS:2 [Entrophospora sp. SA101]
MCHPIHEIQGFWGLAFRVWVTGIVITGYRDKPALNWCLDKKGWSTQK